MLASHGRDAKFIALGLPQICQPGVLPPQGNKLTAVRRFFCTQIRLVSRYTMLNDSANFLMLLFCKQINTVQKSCYAARRGIGHLPYKLLSHRSVKRTPAAYDNESEENRRARRIP
jgi:hypothetical protein